MRSQQTNEVNIEMIITTLRTRLDQKEVDDFLKNFSQLADEYQSLLFNSIIKFFTWNPLQTRQIINRIYFLN